MNQKANNRLKEIFLSKGITRCELCGNNSWLSYMHRKKRRHYQTVEELTDFNQVILACMSCHTQLEYDRDATEAVFRRLRT